MRKLTKIIGVALIATGLMVSVTGCADPNSGLAELQAENEKLEKDKATFEAWITKLFGDKESAEKFLSEYNTLKEALENDKITEGEYTEELQNLIDKINQLKNDKAKLQKQLDDLKATQKDFDALKAELDKILEKSETDATTIVKLTAQVKEITEKLETANKALLVAIEKNESDAKTIAAYKDKIDGLNDEISKLEENIKTLTNQKVTYEVAFVWSDSSFAWLKGSTPSFEKVFRKKYFEINTSELSILKEYESYVVGRTNSSKELYRVFSSKEEYDLEFESYSDVESYNCIELKFEFKNNSADTVIVSLGDDLEK